MATEKDIAPALIQGVNKEFQKNCFKDAEMRVLSEKAANGDATYADAYKYAEAVGTARANAFQSQISSEVLPDGKMYYNIAERLMTDSLTMDHEMVSNFAQEVQEALNANSGIRIKAQRADVDDDRINGFVQRLAKEDNYDDVAWILNEPIRVHARSVVDDTIKKNAEFQYKAGIKVKVKRDAASDCCKWCDSLVGDYTYPGVPREVFARHDNCRCTLDYDGRKLTAYESKNGKHSFRDQGEQEKIQRRMDYSDSQSQSYKPVERDADRKKSVNSAGEMISATAIRGSRNGIYLSDQATLKPRELDRIEKQIDSAKKISGLAKENAPAYIVIGDTELNKNTGGRFDPYSNTVFIKPMEDKNKQMHVVTHETIHAKDYQDFTKKGGVFTSQSEYIDYMCTASKKKLDKIGVNEYNVSEISGYASAAYRLGRYDEVFTEYRTIKGK